MAIYQKLGVREVPKAEALKGELALDTGEASDDDGVMVVDVLTGVDGAPEVAAGLAIPLR